MLFSMVGTFVGTIGKLPPLRTWNCFINIIKLYGMITPNFFTLVGNE